MIITTQTQLRNVNFFHPAPLHNAHPTRHQRSHLPDNHHVTKPSPDLLVPFPAPRSSTSAAAPHSSQTGARGASLHRQQTPTKPPSQGSPASSFKFGRRFEAANTAGRADDCRVVTLGRLAEGVLVSSTESGEPKISSKVPRDACLNRHPSHGAQSATALGEEEVCI